MTPRARCPQCRDGTMRPVPLPPYERDGELFVVVTCERCDTGILFSYDDLAAAIVRGASISAVLPGDELIGNEVAAAVDRLGDILRDLYGPASEVTVHLEEAEDSGEHEIVLEARYTAPRDADEHARLNEILMRRFATEVSPAARGQLLVGPCPREPDDLPDGRDATAGNGGVTEPEETF